MRLRVVFLCMCLGALALPSPAEAYFVHTVAPGESLSSIAAVDGLSVAQLAAANGLSANAQLIAGRGLQIPGQGSFSAPGTSSASTSQIGDGDGDSDDVGQGNGVGSSPGAPPTTSARYAGSSSSVPGGSYTVQPGDTLSAIAARSGTTVSALAAANGLSPTGLVLAGSLLRIPGAATGGVVTVSWFDDPQTASGVAHVPGWAELSNPPGSLNFSAMGHVPFGTMLRASYGGRTIVVPKVDVGAGGRGLGGAIRGVDLTREAAVQLPGFLATRLANMYVELLGAGSRIPRPSARSG